jgi:hypothetical protein
MYIPDNYDTYRAYEAEQARRERMRKRYEIELKRMDEKEEEEWQHYTNSQDNTESC